MRAASRTITWFSLALITAGCGSNDLVSPSGGDPSSATSLAGDVIRMPADAAFRETERFALHGEQMAGGGCHFVVQATVPAGQVRTTRFAELRKSTCDAVLIARNDPYLVGVATGLVPSSSARFSLSPSAARYDFSPSDPSMSSSGDVVYGSTGSTNGSAFESVTAQSVIGGSFETREQLSISYTKANSCLQTLHATNAGRWKSNSQFGWGVEDFNQPQLYGDPCGTFNAYGYLDFSGDTSYAHECGGWGQYYTNFDIFIGLRVSDGAANFGTIADIYTGGCDLVPIIVNGSSGGYY